MSDDDLVELVAEAIHGAVSTVAWDVLGLPEVRNLRKQARAAIEAHRDKQQVRLYEYRTVIECMDGLYYTPWQAGRAPVLAYASDGVVIERRLVGQPERIEGE